MTDPDRLYTLIDAYLDERISSEEMAELDALLRSSPDARAAFHQAMRDHHALIESLVPPTALTEPEPIVMPATQRTASAGRPKVRGIPDAAVYAIAASVGLVAAVVALYVFVFSVEPQPDTPDPNQPGPAVATLIETSEGGNLRTPHGYPAEGDDFSAGEYALSSGTAEFMLTNAVNLKLRGETRMHMRNNMNVSLSRGSAAFVVPNDAKNFTVHLPHGVKVVDLGTAFSVHVDADGAARVTVSDGEIELFTAEGHVHRMVAGDYAAADTQGLLQAERGSIVANDDARRNALIAFDPEIVAEPRSEGPFTVGSLIEIGDEPIVITHLGVQDVPMRGSDEPDGFIGSDPIRVGLWNETGQELLAEVAVHGDAMLIGTYRYAALVNGPIVLDAHTRYVMGALVGKGIEPFIDSQHPDGSSTEFPFASSSQLRLVEGRFTPKTFGAPIQIDAFDPRRWCPVNALHVEKLAPDTPIDTAQEEAADETLPQK